MNPHPTGSWNEEGIWVVSEALQEQNKLFSIESQSMEKNHNTNFKAMYIQALCSCTFVHSQKLSS